MRQMPHGSAYRNRTNGTYNFVIFQASEREGSRKSVRKRKKEKGKEREKRGQKAKQREMTSVEHTADWLRNREKAEAHTAEKRFNPIQTVRYVFQFNLFFSRSSSLYHFVCIAFFWLSQVVIVVNLLRFMRFMNMFCDKNFLSPSLSWLSVSVFVPC